jgi:DNA-binding transcriptional MerR regulator
MTIRIPDKLFFKIGEVAELASVEQHVLRYWEDEIDALKPAKNKSGQRLYQKKDVELVMEIKRLLYEEKFTIAGAKSKLKRFKKKVTQLDFSYDRESFLEWKQGIKYELESILKSLEDSKD